MDKQELLNKKSELEKELGQVNKELWDYDVTVTIYYIRRPLLL